MDKNIILFCLIVLVIFLIFNMSSSKENMTSDDIYQYAIADANTSSMPNTTLSMPNTALSMPNTALSMPNTALYSDQEIYNTPYVYQDSQDVMFPEQDDNMFPEQDDNVPKSEKISYGSMPNTEEKLNGSLYGQSIQGTMNTQNQEGTMPNTEKKLYGSLYGQSLQGTMNTPNQEGSIPNAEEKLYGSLYGQSLQENINIPMPIYDDMNKNFDVPMEIEMDMPINFNNPSDKVHVTNNREDVVKEMYNNMYCTMDYYPVICMDGIKYDNMCKANNAGQMKCKPTFF